MSSDNLQVPIDQLNFRKSFWGIDGSHRSGKAFQLSNIIINILSKAQSEILAVYNASNNGKEEEITLVDIGESASGIIFIMVGQKQIAILRDLDCQDFIGEVLKDDKKFRLLINDIVTKLLGDSIKLSWKKGYFNHVRLYGLRTTEPVSYNSNGQICYKFCQNCGDPTHCDWDAKIWFGRINICQRCAYLTICSACGQDITSADGYTSKHFITHQYGCPSKLKFKNPRDIPVPDDWQELYEKLRPFTNERLLIKKSVGIDNQLTLHNLSSFSYLWRLEYIEPSDISDIEFCAGKFESLKTKIYAYHDYGGYAGFFRPDLLEVIKISQEIIRTADLVYVTTTTCDSNGHPANTIENCFDNELDMHLGCTIFYPIKIG